jgi:hypothetical protein
MFVAPGKIARAVAGYRVQLPVVTPASEKIAGETSVSVTASGNGFELFRCIGQYPKKLFHFAV